jgi:hypothetical protein
MKRTRFFSWINFFAIRNALYWPALPTNKQNRKIPIVVAAVPVAAVALAAAFVTVAAVAVAVVALASVFETAVSDEEAAWGAIKVLGEDDVIGTCATPSAKEVPESLFAKFEHVKS